MKRPKMLAVLPRVLLGGVNHIFWSCLFQSGLCRVSEVCDRCEVQCDGVRQFYQSEAEQTTIIKVY